MIDVPSTDFDPNSRDVDESHRPGPDNVIAPPSTFHDPSKGINQETYPVTLQTMEYAVKFKTLRPPQNYLLLVIHIRHPSHIQTSKPRTNLRNTQHRGRVKPSTTEIIDPTKRYLRQDDPLQPRGGKNNLHSNFYHHHSKMYRC